jgi:hypothetical protein
MIIIIIIVNVPQTLIVALPHLQDVILQLINVKDVLLIVIVLISIQHQCACLVLDNVWNVQQILIVDLHIINAIMIIIIVNTHIQIIVQATLIVIVLIHQIVSLDNVQVVMMIHNALNSQINLIVFLAHV